MFKRAKSNVQIDIRLQENSGEKSRAHKLFCCTTGFKKKKIFSDFSTIVAVGRYAE